MTQERSAFYYDEGDLLCDRVALRTVAEEVGTPCYVYSRRTIVQNYQRFAAAFSILPHQICYAIKANSNLSILKVLAAEGSGFDVVSIGELFRLQSIGADLSRVLFSGVGKTREELEAALQLPLLAINLESIAEIELLAGLAAEKGLRPRVSLRINPDVQVETHPYISTGLRRHKFGIDIQQVESALDLLQQQRHLELVAVGCHIGSQILEIQPFVEAARKMVEIARTFEARDLQVKHIDLGGGIGIPYREESRPDLSAYARALAGLQNKWSYLFEPGRYIVGDAGVLLNRVLYRKTNHGKNFVVVDGAMNDLMRPSLYQAHHEVLPLRRGQALVQADLVGPVCETGDFFARDRLIPDLQEGDYLALLNAGAYGFVLASNYNSRRRAAEVLVEGDQFRVIRKRDTFEDLIRGE